MITRSKVGIFKPKVFLVEHSLPREPSTFLEARQDPNWWKALNSEYAALLHNHTWTVVEAPPNASIVGCRWVFKVKTNPDGTVVRYKARLVAKGYSQTPRFNYNETFSLVIKHATIRTVLTLAMSKGRCVRQVDVINAFLNGALNEVVYMRQPPGFEVPNSTTSLVFKLNKAIYGLKQASRAWLDRLRQALHNLGFIHSNGRCFPVSQI